MTLTAERFTPQQRRVASLLLAGESMKEIGQRMGLTERTVIHYAGEIYARAAVRTRAQFMALAIAGKLDL